MLSNTEAKLKKSIAYKKEACMQIFEIETIFRLWDKILLKQTLLIGFSQCSKTN